MKRGLILGCFIVLIFLISGVASLPYFGLSWDEGLGNLFFGNRYFYYLTSFEEKYLDFSADLAVDHQGLDLSVAPFRDVPQEFPALADTLSAAFMVILGNKLQLLDPVDAFHLFTIALAAVLVWVIYRFMAPRWGERAALFSMAFLAFFPRFWGDMHFNPKDVPSTVFISLSLIAYMKWLEHPNWKGALEAGALTGCAMGVKANALFIPVIIMIGILPWSIKPKEWIGFVRQVFRLSWHYMLMAASGVLVYYLSWPFLYGVPGRVLDYLRYIFSQGGRPGQGVWSIQPLQLAITTMPEVMLATCLLGILWVVSTIFQTDGEHERTQNRLLMAWLILPILRISTPVAVNFDGIRHYLEFVPAAAMLAGIGLDHSFDYVKVQIPKFSRFAWVSALVLLAANYTWIGVRFFPNTHLYFNQLVGGLRGASQVFGPDEASDYWGTSYRQGLDWLIDHAEAGAGVYTPVAEWLVRIPGELWLRQDMRVLLESEVDAYPGPSYVMVLLRPKFLEELSLHLVMSHTPIHQLYQDGAPILAIYRLDK